MIVITGAAGFIASCLTAKLNSEGFNDLILVDDFSNKERENNYSTKKYSSLVEREEFFTWLDNNHKQVEFIFHLGARSDTTEYDINLLNKLNTEYSKTIWRKSFEYAIPLIYASSAATYGDGSLGFDDNIPSENLKPLNPYGVSKNDFDIWASKQDEKPYFYMGFKFFNVYGPNEYHKKRMASVILHSYNQILETKKMKLFKSNNLDYKDGEQLRDFVYVKDIVDVLFFFMNNRDRKNNGIYNLGTGKARSFNSLVKAVFSSLNIQENIEYIDMPKDISDKYQYYTQANMEKLRKAGYSKDFYSLEDGVADYVKNYLITSKYF